MTHPKAIEMATKLVKDDANFRISSRSDHVRITGADKRDGYRKGDIRLNIVATNKTSAGVADKTQEGRL